MPHSLVKCTDISDGPAAFDIRTDIYIESLICPDDRCSRILQNKMSITVHYVTSLKSYKAYGGKIIKEM
jgi:hypothetical protein